MPGWIATKVSYLLLIHNELQLPSAVIVHVAILCYDLHADGGEYELLEATLPTRHSTETLWSSAGRGLLSPCCWETNRAGKIHLQYPLLPQEKEPGL